MKKHEANLKKKIYFLLGLFSLSILLLMAWGVRHQVINRDTYLSWARKHEIKPIRLVPLRGKILDREGRPLAVSLKAGSLYAHPAGVEDPRETARMLAEHMELDPLQLEEKLTKETSFTWLSRQMPMEKAQAVMKLGVSGIGLQREGKRYYPNRELAGHVLGFAGIDSQGLEGIEWGFHEVLKGREGTLMLQQDARGRVLWQDVTLQSGSETGCELHLTLDLRLQYFTEKALQRAVRESQAISGMAIVMDPRSGELLAMACAPSFNPNRFRDFGFSQWRNRVITDAFEPGSTIKPFLLAAALEEGVVSETSSVFCENGEFSYGGETIHDMKPHKKLTVREVLTVSSNIGISKIADALGARDVWDCLNAFGFGRKTGVDLPGEVSGSIRAWRKWSKIELATHAYGQGFSSTVIQLVSAFSVLANGGFLIEPYAVQRILNEDGKVLMEKKPRVVRRVILKRTADRVLRVLESVVEKGTGKEARIPGYPVAGKTGTAQKFDLETKKFSKERSVVSFVGIVPSDKPEMVIAVVLDEPRGKASGGKLAAPVFREIASRCLHYRQVPGRAPVLKEQDVPMQLCSAVSVREQEKQGAVMGESGTGKEALRMPELRGLPLRSAMRALEGLPVKVSLEGSGRVTSQEPGPFTLLERGQTLHLQASPSRTREAG